MARISVNLNPAEIRVFAKNLNQYNQDLISRTKLLNTKFNRLGDTWKDKDFQEYSKHFTQTIKLLQQFTKASEEYCHYLSKLAEKASKV